MLLLALLPLFFWFLSFLIFWQINSDTTYRRIRIAFLNATIVSGLWVVGLTEMLSAFRAITRTGLVLGWLTGIVILLIFLWRSRRWFSGLRTFTLQALKALTGSWMLIVISLLLLISFGVAITYPTNNYDSLTYHMARVAHWAQQKSISHYQTHILKQLIYPPFAEWSILHLQVLTGGDRFANAVQLLFFGGCILNVSLIVSELGGNKHKQLLSALLTCVLPMAIIQSNTTQNDIVVAFFVLGFVFYMIRLLKNLSYINIFLCGAVLGLAMLSKGTAYLFVLPFFSWFLIFFIREYKAPLYRLLKKALLLAAIPLLAFILNYGHFYRNSFLTGEYFGGGSENMSNETFAPRVLALVTIKNFMNHMPATRELKKKVTNLAGMWQLDIDDPRFNRTTDISWMQEELTFHEDYVQNFLQAIFIVAFGLVFFFKRELYTAPVSYYVLFALTAIGCALFYCFLLKYQAWSNRLETTIFMFFCVFLAWEIGELWKWVRPLFYLPMVVYGVAALLCSFRHPIFPIENSLFRQSYLSLFHYQKGVFECADYINSTRYTKVGLYIGPDTPDYPYYKLISDVDGRPRTIKHMFVDNESAMYLDNFIPEIIVSYELVRDKYVVNDRIYKRTKNFTDEPAVFELTEPEVTY